MTTAFHAGEMLCVADAEGMAAEIMSREVWDFVAGGAGEEITLAANRAALDGVCLVPRVLTGITECNLSTALAGRVSAMPVAVAPMSYQRLVHPEGEAGLAGGARAAGIPYIVPMLTSTPLADIAAAGGDLWFQLYLLRDREQVTGLIKQAEEAGCRALVLTADLPRMARRIRDMRNGFALPAGVSAVMLRGDDHPAHLPQMGSSAAADHLNGLFEPALGWDDVAWVRDHTSLPLILKGLLDPADASRAVHEGVDAIVVSNHGGRQLDGALASAAALPAIVKAVAGRCQVLLDSGIRSGTDVLRALVLGASGVLLGRPALWGLAAGGAEGAERVLALLREELTEAMTLAGCADVGAAPALRTVTNRREPCP